MQIMPRGFDGGLSPAFGKGQTVEGVGPNSIDRPGAYSKGRAVPASEESQSPSLIVA